MINIKETEQAIRKLAFSPTWERTESISKLKDLALLLLLKVEMYQEEEVKE